MAVYPDIRVPVDLIDQLGTRYRRYARVVPPDPTREREFGPLVEGGVFRKSYVIVAAPPLLTRDWQLVDRQDHNWVWEIEGVVGYALEREVRCVRYNDVFDDELPNPLDTVVQSYDGIVFGYGGFAMGWSGDP